MGSSWLGFWYRDLLVVRCLFLEFWWCFFWLRLPKLFSEFWPLAHEEYILLEKYTWNDNNNKKCFNFNKWIEISLDISRFIIIDQHFETKMSKNQNWSQIYIGKLCSFCFEILHEHYIKDSWVAFLFTTRLLN